MTLNVLEQYYGKEWDHILAETTLLQHPNIEHVEVHEKDAILPALARPKTALVWLNKDETIESITKGDPLEEWEE